MIARFRQTFGLDSERGEPVGSNMLLFRTDRSAAPKHAAISDELEEIRDWLSPKVLHYSGQPPFVWIWTTPALGLVIQELEGSWYATPHLYGENQAPKYGGFQASALQSVDPESIAREIVSNHVQHSLATYASLPSMQVEGYDSAWALDEMHSLIRDGYS